MASKLLLLPLVPALAFSIVEVASRPVPKVARPMEIKRVLVTTPPAPPLPTEWCGTALSY